MAELKEDDEIQIVETLPSGAQDDVTDVEPKVVQDHDDEDERDVHPDDPDDTDAEREAIRERRRKEKIERKERREQAINRDKLELDFLRKRNDELERRMSAQEQRAHKSDLDAVDQRLREAINEVEMAEKVISKAVAAGNGEDVTQAMRYRDQAMQRAKELEASKRQAASPRDPGVDPALLNHAQQFLSENTWYDPQGRDEDSAVVMAVDQAVARDGYDPRSPEYWAELRKRVSRRLPERFAPKAEQPAKTEPREARGGPSVGSGREHAPASTRREVYISPERKQALVDAGVWDDPVLRQKYVKRYMDYDRSNRA